MLHENIRGRKKMEERNSEIRQKLITHFSKDSHTEFTVEKVFTSFNIDGKPTCEVDMIVCGRRVINSPINTITYDKDTFQKLVNNLAKEVDFCRELKQNNTI